jgi:hypothetical protein
MAKPRFADRQIIAIEKVGDDFTVSVLTAPTGIWRETGPRSSFKSGRDAQNAAVLLMDSTGASILMDFDAAFARAEEEGLA